MFDHTKFTTVEEAAEAAGVVALPDPPTVAQAIAAPPQEPQHWPDVLMTGRWEDSNPPGTPR